MSTDEKKRILQAPRDFDTLCAIMALLRTPEGCPWDREQTHDSVRKNLLEEAYEACDAIDAKDSAALCEELGDLLLQVVFHAQMAKEANEFEMKDVLAGICEKLIVRHPHVFGTESVEGSSEVLKNWETIKNKTKGMNTLAQTLEGVARALPALQRSQKLISRTQKQNISPEAIAPIPENESQRIGKALFSLCEQAQNAGIDAEEALTLYNNLYVKQSHTTKCR